MQSSSACISARPCHGRDSWDRNCWLPAASCCRLQLALDEAQELMDIAAAGEGSSFDAIRQPLAEAYQKAGLVDVANFIKAA